MNGLEYEAVNFEISGRGSGRLYYHAKEGLYEMYNIRAWCGSRQDVPSPEERRSWSA